MSEHHQLEFNGQLIETDAKGYLLNSNDWSEALALVLAEQEGIVLEEPHWEVVRFVRTGQGDGEAVRAREGQQPLPLQAVPGRPRQAGHQDWRPAQTGEMHLKKYRAHPK